MKEKFADRKLTGNITIKMDEAKGTWHGDKATVVSSIIKISEEYMNNNDTLTLRQLYYQLVSRDIIPNHDKVYKKISSIKDDIVYSGLVDWDAFEDRGRKPIQAYYEYNIKDALRRTVRSYSLDKQLNQPIHIEVWTEKDAISSILDRVTRPYTIRLAVNKGYTSSTAMYEAYCRFVECIENGQKVRILYFGDHDPSGLDMIRDIRDRLTFMFTTGEQLPESDIIQDWWDREEKTYYDISYLEGYEDLPERFDNDDYSTDLMRDFESGKVLLWLTENDMFEIIPVGLTMQQIRQYNPPPNPAKITDPRAKDYVKIYGEVSWEVDALTPDTMRAMVGEAIIRHMDMDVYQKVVDRERSEIAEIKDIIDKY